MARARKPGFEKQSPKRRRWQGYKDAIDGWSKKSEDSEYLVGYDLGLEAKKGFKLPPGYKLKD